MNSMLRRTGSLVRLLVVGWLLLSAGVCDQVEVSAQESPSSGEPKSIQYWVEQLGNESYLRREMASKTLVSAGAAAVGPLADVIRVGDLEVVERATAALIEIATDNMPREDGGAYERLRLLARQTVGRSASITRGAQREVSQFRYRQARDSLAAAGVPVGMTEFAIGAQSLPRMLVQIDQRWNGDTDVLQWLAWLEGVENARVSIPHVTKQVVECVAQIPDLRSLVIADAAIDEAALEPLTRISQIETLDIRYARLTSKQGEMIVAIPLRSSLNLMGTGLSEQQVDAMRAATPGLNIEFRRGGFMGVTCTDNFESCIINSVLERSAAEAAGLIAGDVIVQIGETPVHRFRDLQDAINECVAGDEVEVQYRRADKIESVKLRLRRYEGP